MKKLIKTLSVTLSIVLFVTELTSCGNLLIKDIDTAKQQPSSRQTGCITGSYTVEGAVPSTLLNARQANSRTAFPGLDIGSGEATFVVEAIPDTADYETKYGTFNDKNFSINGLVLDIPYTIKARLISNFDESILLEGTASEKVTLTSASPTKAIGTIKLLPAQTAEGTGDIYLCIDTSEVTNKPSKVNVSLEKVTDGSALDPQTFNYSDGFNIDIEDVPSGAWNMQISVYSRIEDYEQDVLVFRCTEVVNVFDNLLTDYWVKNGNEAYLNGDNFNAEFQLTNSIIERFQKTSFYVDTSTGVNAGSGSYFSPFNSVQTALTEMVYYEPELEKTLYIRGNGEGEQITNDFNTEADLNLSIEVYKAETTDPGTFRIETGVDYAFYVNEGSTLNVKGLTFDGTGFINGGEGGFFYVNGGTANFTDCTFSNGSSCADGGAIANNGGTVTLTDCYFEGNNSYVDKADEGPNAIYGYNGSVTKIAGSTWFSPNDPILLDGTGKLEIDPTLSLPSAASGKCAVIELDDYTRTEPFITVTSGTVDAVKGYFLLENYAITSEGLATTGTISMNAYTADGDPMFLGETTWEDAFKEAFSKRFPSYTITIPDGSYFTWPDYYNDNDNDIHYDYHRIDSNNISITTSGRATVKIEKPVDCNDNYSFYAYGIDFIGSGESSINSGGLFFLNSQNKENPHDASFRNCSFSNGKSDDEGGAIYNQATLTLENCTFSNNFMYGDTANDVVSWNGELKLLETNSFSSPICINKSSMNSSTPAIYLNGGTVLSEGKTTYASISCIDWLSEYQWITTGHKIIQFSDNGEVKELDGRENWFPVVDEGYAIGSNGCLKAVNTLYVGSTGTTLKNAVSQCNTEKDNIIWVESGYSETLDDQLVMTGIKADIRVTDSLSSPSISANGNCTLNLSGNRAHLIIQSDSTITFTGINFAREAGDSLSGEGGIIYNVGSSNVTCTRCSFTNGTSAVNTSNNSGGPGGAIFNNATLTLNSCTFTNCSSAKEGGAIYNGGTMTLGGCTFRGNTASSVSNDIYHTGTSVTLKAGNIFDGGIKLESGKMLTIAEALDVVDGTIKITLPSYTVGTQILDGDGMASALSNNIIELADSNYIIDSEGYCRER